MADENTPAGTATPAAQNPPPAAPPSPPVQPDPGWLNPRLAEAKQAEANRILKELGVSDLDAAKAAIADSAARAEASKSAEQKAAELAAKLNSTQTEAQRHAAIISEHAARMLGVLSEKQQALVKSFAGDDAAQQLSTIQKLTDSGVLVIEDDAPPPPPPPATTAPPPTAPNGAPGTSPPDHAATYAQLKQSNPFAAAAYGARNPSVYQPKG